MGIHVTILVKTFYFTIDIFCFTIDICNSFKIILPPYGTWRHLILDTEWVIIELINLQNSTKGLDFFLAK